MGPYCLDSNVFIEAKNGPYGMDIVPAFWEFLDKKIEEEIIYSPITVYDELTSWKDELSEWVRKRKNSGLFVYPPDSVQNQFSVIADYVNNNYGQAQAEEFLGGADPWVIAHAIVDGSIVITHEKPVGPESQKIKIPNICDYFGVNYMNPYEMLRELGARFTL